jgi:hypothetical protein
MSKFFPEIQDILNRHRTLTEANRSLIEKHKLDEGINDNTFREFHSFRKFKENQLLNESNEVAEMQLALEQVKNKGLRVQQEVEQLTLEASEKTLELGEIISSVSNLLERCEESFRIRHNKPHVDKSLIDRLTSQLSVGEQCQKTKSKLDEIAMFMVDYRDIIVEFSSTQHEFVPLSMPKSRTTTNIAASMSVVSGPTEAFDSGH